MRNGHICPVWYGTYHTTGLPGTQIPYYDLLLANYYNTYILKLDL